MCLGVFFQKIQCVGTIRKFLRLAMSNNGSLSGICNFDHQMYLLCIIPTRQNMESHYLPLVAPNLLRSHLKDYHSHDHDDKFILHALI